MSRKNQILILSTLSILFFACSDGGEKNIPQHKIEEEIKEVEIDIEEKNFPEVKNISEYNATEFIPTLESKINKDKNAIYCATLLFAWEEVKKLIDAPIDVDKNDEDLFLLNNSKSYVGVLKPHEYYAYGEVVEGDIIAKSKFNKSLPFEEDLMDIPNLLTFNEVKVESFGARGDGHGFKILYYKNDENFIIKLYPKDEEHEIILYKSDKNYKTMSDIINDMKSNILLGKKESNDEKKFWKYEFNHLDKLTIPKLNFNIENSFQTIENRIIKTAKDSLFITKAWQRIAFILNEKGAEVESEAEMVIEAAEFFEEEYEKPKPKNLVFDKSFFVALKRVDNENPYLGLWITNPELMIKE